jgi:UDP-N-acetylglucosamine 2-epimerase (non-hydrolysing)
MATAMACFYEGIALGHVEAGLRTFDLRAPFPEEFNRQTAGKVAKWHFAPTSTSRDNLLAERVAPEDVHVTGNTVIDALQFTVARLNDEPQRRAAVEQEIDAKLEFAWRTSRFVLITGHRRENFGDGFLQICQALSELSERFSDTHFVYPVHLNPNVREPVNAHLRNRANISLIEPLTYEPFLHLLNHAHLVLTDSGGIQEEAPSLGKPVLVMRDVTERPEAVDAGTVRLVGADKARIVAQVAELIENEATYRQMSRAHNPYGDGLASQRIAEVLESY